jgi:hypothetical protein
MPEDEVQKMKKEQADLEKEWLFNTHRREASLSLIHCEACLQFDVCPLAHLTLHGCITRMHQVKVCISAMLVHFREAFRHLFADDETRRIINLARDHPEGAAASRLQQIGQWFSHQMLSGTGDPTYKAVTPTPVFGGRALPALLHAIKGYDNLLKVGGQQLGSMKDVIEL